MGVLRTTLLGLVTAAAVAAEDEGSLRNSTPLPDQQVAAAAASADTSLNVISGAGVAAPSFARRARRISTSSHMRSRARSISRQPSISQ